MKNITTILFDLGGVLVDWNPAYFYKTVFTSEEKMKWFLTHVCSPKWNDEQDGGRTISEAERVLIAKFPEYKNEIEAFYPNWHKMFAGSIEENVNIFKNLKENGNYKLFALTNWSAEKWDEGVALFPFLNDFEDVIVSGKVKMRKPHPNIFNLAIKRFNLTPTETLFIDDNKNNIKTAKSLGFNTIHLKTNNNLKQELKSYNIIFQKK